MKAHDPDLAFKGGRLYVHGTTIYDQILEGAEVVGLGKPDGELEIENRAMLAEQARFFYSDTEEGGDKVRAATSVFRLNIGKKEVHGWVVPTGEPVQAKVPYDEEEIEQYARYSEKTATLTGVPSCSPIEVSSCMAVGLHQFVYPPPTGMKWLLARVKLARPFRTEDICSLTLTIRRKIGNRFTETGIFADNIELGSFGFFLNAVDEPRDLE
ncbi:MAG: hypothetical protein HQ513_15365 [Rhodospirillales bacterium]|nr:hypothetical protein [Rhodospirillales bacterium]